MEYSTLERYIEESLLIEGYSLDQYKCFNMIEAYNELVKEDELTLDSLIESHKCIVKHQPKAQELYGLRSCNVLIGGYSPCSPMAVYNLIEDWIEDYNKVLKYNTSEARSYINLLCDNHIKFETIHPFVDGNGRMGRLLFLRGSAKLINYAWLDKKITLEELNNSTVWFLQQMYYYSFYLYRNMLRG